MNVNLTLYFTNRCNMDCSYCTQDKNAACMTEDVLHAACELAFSAGPHAGFCFFGGEPLLCENLIFEAMDLCAGLSAESGKPVYYRMTTNGTLLSQQMCDRAVREHMEIGLSFDGLMQNTCRKYADGTASFADVEAAAKRLLAVMPAATAMMTVAPQAAERYAASVRYLYALGFRSIHAVPAYGKKVTWNHEALETMRRQLDEIAELYSECLRADAPFYFSPIDTKIRCLLNRTSPGDHCHLGMTQMAVAPDGTIYACNQFLGDAACCLGNVFDGISVEKCTVLALKHSVPEQCRGCSFQTRCLNTCGCLNRLECGDEAVVSEFQCAYEKTLIRLADEITANLCETERIRFDRWFRYEGTR